MPSAVASFRLDPAQFATPERVIATFGGITATAFRYGSGVAGLRVSNGAGEIVVLPFQGQQVWDARFHGRRLTMRSMFEEPQPTRDYLRSYGALLLHCGGTAMGNPGPDDRHPLHGELPALPMNEAWLDFGRDEQGAFLDIRGEGRDVLAFSHDFVARPRLRLREDSSIMEVELVVDNRAASPLPFMYLAHINFLPVDGGMLHDAADDDRVVVRPQKLEGVPDATRRYHERVNADPALHRQIEPGIEVLPELVLTMQVLADAYGATQVLQQHPDGSGDVVNYRPSELPYAVRWMTRGPNQDALGLVLPATAPPDGQAAARREGQLLWIAPGSAFRTQYSFGALDAASTDLLVKSIEALRQR